MLVHFEDPNLPWASKPGWIPSLPYLFTCSGPVYTKRAILFSLKSVESLENRLQPQSGTTPLLPSATKLRRLCFYRCLSVHRRSVCLSTCWDTPWEQTPPEQTPPSPEQTPPGADTDAWCKWALRVPLY